MAASRMPQAVTGQASCVRGAASTHSPASHEGMRIADRAKCGQSPSSRYPAIAPMAHRRIADGQCSCILKICPAMAMAPPSATVPTAWRVMPRARKRSSESAPARWKAAHREYEKRHALEGRELIPVRADEEEDAGREHDAAEGEGHDYGPARAPLGRLFRFELPDAIGLLQVEDLRLYPTIQRWFEFHSHGSHLD